LPICTIFYCHPHFLCLFKLKCILFPAKLGYVSKVGVKLGKPDEEKG